MRLTQVLKLLDNWLLITTITSELSLIVSYLIKVPIGKINLKNDFAANNYVLAEEYINLSQAANVG